MGQRGAKRFLPLQRYAIVMIATFGALQKHRGAYFEGTGIIICSNKIFQDNKYHSGVSEYCSTNGLEKLRMLQKVYRAWYKHRGAYLASADIIICSNKVSAVQRDSFSPSTCFPSMYRGKSTATHTTSYWASVTQQSVLNHCSSRPKSLANHLHKAQ